MTLINPSVGKEATITTVYAKCTTIERMQLWESLEQVATRIQSAWMVGGDFNVILSPNKKKRRTTSYNSGNYRFYFLC